MHPKSSAGAIVVARDVLRFRPWREGDEERTRDGTDLDVCELAGIPALAELRVMEVACERDLKVLEELAELRRVGIFHESGDENPKILRLLSDNPREEGVLGHRDTADTDRTRHFLRVRACIGRVIES
jgi:hypothetical protein